MRDRGAYDEDIDIIARNAALSTNCSLCDRRVGSVLIRSGTPCTICAKTVCSRCSVVKKLRFSRSDGNDAVTNTGVNLGEAWAFVTSYSRRNPKHRLSEVAAAAAVGAAAPT